MTPRLHDIRHTAAVHRVIGWYRSGAKCSIVCLNWQRILDTSISAPLSAISNMTSELLQEASFRFERYANQEVCHA